MNVNNENNLYGYSEYGYNNNEHDDGYDYDNNGNNYE